ncbi:MAG: ATP-binding cassette domain-containing protein [Collinsella sp.]
MGYGSTTILSIGSLFLSPGTAAGLIAPNGSGKTTFLEALSGQFPTRIRSGSLAADGICQRRSAEFAELVYLSSSGGADLYPTLSALEHLSFVREAWKSAADIDSLCNSLGISPYLDKPARKLSTGMKQQVKLAMAIATDCPYLILDEPLNGLDPEKRKTSCDAMRSEVARGRSVLISSHLLDDLADLTNSFYFIEAGTLVEKIKSSSQMLKQEYLDTYEGGE